MIEKEKDLLLEEKKSITQLEIQIQKLVEDLKLKAEEIKHLRKFTKEISENT